MDKVMKEGAMAPRLGMWASVDTPILIKIREHESALSLYLKLINLTKDGKVEKIENGVYSQIVLFYMPINNWEQEKNYTVYTLGLNKGQFQRISVGGCNSVKPMQFDAWVKETGFSPIIVDGVPNLSKGLLHSKFCLAEVECDGVKNRVPVPHEVARKNILNYLKSTNFKALGNKYLAVYMGINTPNVECEFIEQFHMTRKWLKNEFAINIKEIFDI